MITRTFTTMSEILYHTPPSVYDFFPAGLERITEPFGPCWIQVIYLAEEAPHTVFRGPSISGDLAEWYQRFQNDGTANHASLASKLAIRPLCEGDVAVTRSPKDAGLNYFVFVEGWRKINEDGYRAWLRHRSATAGLPGELSAPTEEPSKALT